MNLPALIQSKLVKLIPMLGSDKDGEIVATVAAIGRTLRGAGLDWHAFATAVAGRVDEPTPAGNLAVARIDRMLASPSLSSWERHFLHSIRDQAIMWGDDFEPSEKQLAVIYRIARKVRQ